MSLLTSGAGGILRPEDVGPLVVEPVRRASVAMQVATVITTESHEFRIPRVTSEVTAHWTPEGQEITPSDAGISELTVTPTKLAALSIISNELANDSNPAAQQVVGESIAGDLATKIDAAFFADTTANGPDGIDSITGGQFVNNGGAFTDLDAFAEAISKAETVGAQITSFVAHPATLLELQTIKVGTNFNQPLLGLDPTSPTKRAILGVPVYWNNTIPQGRVWGIPKMKVFVVMRQDVNLVVDSSAYFSSDRLGVRATIRVGFGFPHEAALISIGEGGS